MHCVCFRMRVMECGGKTSIFASEITDIHTFMFRKLINLSVRVVQRYLPEPFVFALILSFVSAVCAMSFAGQSPLEVLGNWGGGLWELLGFSMQMALVLVCGSALADTAPVRKVLAAAASLPKTPFQAIAMVTAVSLAACWINWGFGLIVGVVFAKQIAGCVRNVDYRLLIASAYSGFVVWHSGISASIPLAMATEGPALAEVSRGVITEPVAMSRTVFSLFNLLIAGGVCIALTVVNTLMHPKASDTVAVDPALLREVKDSYVPAKTPAGALENSPVLSYAMALAGLGYLVYSLGFQGRGLDLNGVIMIFLFLGILLHRTPMAYVRSVNKAASASAGILLQFPFYAGIMGIMTGVSSEGVSLAGRISELCVNVSNADTFPLLSFLSAGLVNIFVPSGGGQWAVQAPIMIPAGYELGVDPAVTGMAIAWGDAWTNLIQPFWAIPALAIAGLGAKDIMGFCLVDLLVVGIIVGLGFLFLV